MHFIFGLPFLLSNRETKRDDFVFYTNRLACLVIEYALSFLPFQVRLGREGRAGREGGGREGVREGGREGGRGVGGGEGGREGGSEGGWGWEGGREGGREDGMIMLFALFSGL